MRFLQHFDLKRINTQRGFVLLFLKWRSGLEITGAKIATALLKILGEMELIKIRRRKLPFVALSNHVIR